MPINLATTSVVARGFLLLGVFYVHVLYGVYGYVGSVDQAVLTGLQIKLFAPNVSIFFILAGIASRGLGTKKLRPSLRYSFSLLLLAVFSHAIAVVAEMLAVEGRPRLEAWERLVQPILYGTGHANYVAWFFLVLGIARMFAWAFEKSKLAFVAAIAICAALVAAGEALGLPDNFYEWRNWPIAVLFFLLGVHLPKTLGVPHAVGVICLPASLIAGWLNRPGLLDSPLCWTCNLDFVGQPMLGQLGFLPAYIAQQLLFLVFLLYISSVVPSTKAGRLGLYFGRRSLPMLILHGWLLVVLLPYVFAILPQKESLVLFAMISGSIVVVHVALYALLRPILEQFIAKTFALSGFVFSLGDLSSRRALASFAARD